MEDEGQLLVAAAAMFTEEVGFDPIARYGDGYRARLHGLIRAKRCAIVTDASGRVIFKADAGIASLDTAQVQGCVDAPGLPRPGLGKALLRGGLAGAAAPLQAPEPLRERLQYGGNGSVQRYRLGADWPVFDHHF